MTSRKMTLLPINIKKQIAGELVKKLVPIVLIAVFLSALVDSILIPGELRRLIPSLIGFLLLVPAWGLALRGNTFAAVNLTIFTVVLPILTGMFLNGGITAPVSLGIISVPCVVVFVYGARPGFAVAVFLMAMAILFTHLVRTGFLPDPQQGVSDAYVFFNYGFWTFLALSLFSIPVNMLKKNLSEQEQQILALRSAMEQKLEAEEKLKQLAVVVEQAGDEIVITDPSGTMVYVNPSVVASSGYQAEELIGKNLRIMKSEKHDPDFYKTLWETISQGGTWKGRIWNRSKNNALMLHDSTITPILDNDRKITAFVSVRRDITDLIRMQDRMVQSEKMTALGGLAAGMAHEINNPLGIILQMTQNIVRRVDPDFPKNREQAEKLGLDLDLTARYLSNRSIDAYLDAVRVAGERAAKIVRSMLEFSRTSDSEKRMCSVNKILDDVLEMAANDYDLKKQYDFKDIHIVKKYSDIDGVWCLESEIGQVLLNIIKNAAQAMNGDKQNARQAQIILTTSQDKENVRIEIEDNGPGMEDGKKKEIFQPFYTTKPPGQGTGLGLSISYFIIGFHHNGTIEVSSEKNRGSCFIIELPKGPHGNMGV